ncbi:MAG: helix-turn-helix domain-containing protein, partial [Gammaproteobacteria bacterium]
LALALLERSCKRLRRPVSRLSPAALAAIESHDWPGNVRELENALERAVILSDGNTIGPELMLLGERSFDNALDDGPESGISPNDYFRRFVAAHQDELTETELAERLGISRKTLWERRKRLGVPRPAAH